MFDPSFTDESGGNVRNVSSPDINIDDFSSAIDYLDALDVVDSDKIGVLGVCGWGCYTFPLVAMDTRTKAVVSSTMGIFDQLENSEDRIATHKHLNELRSKMIRGEKVDPLITVPDID